MDIVGNRYWYFALSLLIIVPGIVGLALWGLPLAIDFTGGSLLEVSFAGTVPQPGEVKALYEENGFSDAVVQTTGQSGIVIRSKTLDNDTKDKIIAALSAEFSQATLQRFESVGPAVGAEVARRAAGAVALAALGILLYITYAFRKVPHAFRYGVCAILAMLHDVAVVFGVQAWLSHFFGWQVDSLFLTALLTVIGFSVHDTIVVFDRIRENQQVYRRLDFETVVNHCVDQTAAREIYTQLTVMLTLLALALFGGVTIRHFVIILLAGVFSGTYSSIFNAAQLLVVWENAEWRTWFRSRPAAA